MSCTPKVSKTALIGPPAITPVPEGAVLKTTLPAPKWPFISWCNVLPSFNGTLTIFFFASSVAFLIASGTSFALPVPKPTLPLWSPTTTSAAKPKRLPPFTTLATLFIPTNLSTSSVSSLLIILSCLSILAIFSP